MEPQLFFAELGGVCIVDKNMFGSNLYFITDTDADAISNHFRYLVDS